MPVFRRLTAYSSFANPSSTRILSAMHSLKSAEHNDSPSNALWIRPFYQNFKANISVFFRTCQPSPMAVFRRQTAHVSLLKPAVPRQWYPLIDQAQKNGECCYLKGYNSGASLRNVWKIETMRFPVTSKHLDVSLLRFLFGTEEPQSLKEGCLNMHFYRK